MINGILENQKQHNINERIRLNKLDKKFNNYETKQNRLNKKYNTKNEVKKIYVIKKPQEYHNKPELNPLIKKINIVYQYDYLNNDSVTGLGDFIRSCYFMNQISEKYNIEVSFHINKHPIKKYLQYFENNEFISEEILKNIQFFKYKNYVYTYHNNIINYKYKNNDQILINYLNSLQLYDGNVYLYLINHPDEEYITDLHKEKIANIFKPTNYLNDKITHAMNEINLNKYKFKVIHIRTEDKFLNNNIILNNRINYIIYTLRSIISRTYDDLFLISNNNYLKNMLLHKVPKLKTIIYNISHIADKDINDEQLINTLKDFYIMSNSNSIYSFSVYNHGSGFSKWCATTYNIPYVCYLLE